MVSGTTISNQAQVKFDTRPLYTPPLWLNLFDFDPPTSHVDGPFPQYTVNGIPLTWSGTDALSGIMDYTVYIAKGGRPYNWKVWKSQTTATSGLFIPAPGLDYSFMCVARDSGGNTETMHLFPDDSAHVTVGVGSSRYDLAFAGAIPSPARGGGIVVGFTLPDEKPASIDVIDITGRLVAHREIGAMGRGVHRLDVTRAVQMAPGVYYLRLRRAGQSITRKTVLLR